MFIGFYNKSLILTYLGVAFSIIGISLALSGNLQLAMICMVCAGVCDMFDGKVARACKRTEDEKKFGVEIDSLADIVSFVVFPIVIGYSMGLNCWYHIIGYILLVLAGITRLGYFNVSVIDTDKNNPVKTYSGLPVTSTAIILPAIWFFSELVGNVSFKSLFSLIVYLIAFLFVFNVKIPKIKGIAYTILTVAAIVGVLLILFLI